MKSLLAATLVTVPLLMAPLTGNTQSRSYVRDRPAPELKEILLFQAPAPNFVMWISIGGNAILITGIDPNNNITVTLSDGGSASLPATDMEGRTVGDLVDMASALINEGGFTSSDGPNDPEGDFSGSGDQNSNGAEYE